jgi:hypothetical protein
MERLFSVFYRFMLFLFPVHFLPSKVNTKSAEILYKAIQEWSNVSANTVVLGE